MEVAPTSMIHAAAPHFLWPFAVRYAAHQLNLWPRVWGALSVVRDAKASKVSSRTLCCVFLSFPTDASPWQFYHPVERRVFSSQDVTFDESACFYRLHLHASHPVPLPPLFLVPVPPPVDPLPPQGPAPSGVSQVDPPPLVEPLEISSDSSGPAEGGDPAADDTAATRRSPRLETPPGFPPRPSSPPPQPGAVDSGAETAGAEPGGAETKGEGSVGAGTGGAASGGAATGGASATGAGAAGAAGPGGAHIRGTGAAGGGGAASAGGATGTAGTRGAGAVGTGGAGAAGAGGTAGAGGARGATGAAGSGGAGGIAGAGGARAAGTRGTGGAGAAVPGGARTRGAGAAGAGGAARAGGGGGAIGATGTGGAGGTAGARGAGVAGARGAAGAGGATGAVGAGGAGAGGATGADGARGAGAAGAIGAGAVGIAPHRLFFYPLPQSSLPPPDSVLRQVLSLPSSTGLTLPLMCPLSDQSQPQLLPGSPLPAPAPHTEVSESLNERREPETRASTHVRARHVTRPRPPAVPGTHGMTLCPSSVPLRVVLPEPPASSLPHVLDPESNLARAATLIVTRLLATVVTDPEFESTAAFALVTELVDFAARNCLDYVTSLVTEFESMCPLSIEGEPALSSDVLEDRQFELECLSTALPRFVSMLLCPEGDPDALDIPTPRSYVEAIAGEYSSQWQTAMDAEMAAWKSTGTYVDEVPPPRANIVDGMWIFRVKRQTGSPPAFKAHYIARGFSQRLGVDFFQTFSPTLKMTTLRVLLHVAAQRDYELHSLDLSTTFLQGSLHEEIWLRLPPGFTGSFLAGTQTTLAALGFATSSAGPSLFLCTDTTLPPFYVLVYIDDLGFATADTEALALVKAELQKRHTCTRDTPAEETRLGYEAEIYTGVMAAQELRWLTYLLTDLGERPRSPPVLYIDNKAMLALSASSAPPSYVASRANTNDVFTKALGSGDHQGFCTALGLVPTLPHLLVA
ncbi:unnamed protein product [Closterium sp. NIES-54]